MGEYGVGGLGEDGFNGRSKTILVLYEVRHRDPFQSPEMRPEREEVLRTGRRREREKEEASSFELGSRLRKL